MSRLARSAGPHEEAGSQTSKSEQHPTWVSPDADCLATGTLYLGNYSGALKVASWHTSHIGGHQHTRTAVHTFDALQFFARGCFAWPTITEFKGPGEGLVSRLRLMGWAMRALSLSALDWPLRHMSKGMCLDKTSHCHPCFQLKRVICAAS